MDLSTTNGTCFEKYGEKVNIGGEHFILPVVGLGLLNLIVVGGNILVVLAVATSPRLRSVNGLLITSLAVADLMVGLAVLPFSISNEAMSGLWVFGELWCQIWLAVDVWMCTASIYNLVAISVDRYLAILKPFAYPSLVTISRAKLLIAAVWICSFLICFPPMATHWPEALSHQSPTRCVCSPMSNSPAYIIYSASGSFFLPMLIIVFVYSRLYLTARKAVRNLYTGEVKIGKNTEALRVHSRKSSSNSPAAVLGRSRHHSFLTVQNLDGTPVLVTKSRHHTTSRASSPAVSHAKNQFLMVPSTTNFDVSPPQVQLTAKMKQQNDEIGERRGNHTSSALLQASGGALHLATAPLKRRRVSVLLAYWLRRSSMAFQKSSSTSQSRLSMEIRAAKTVAVVTGCFIFCWLGFAVVYTIQAFPHCQKNPDCISKTVFSVVFWMGYLNSVLNPIIYAVLNKEFRRAFKRILSCRCY